MNYTDVCAAAVAGRPDAFIRDAMQRSAGDSVERFWTTIPHDDSFPPCSGTVGCPPSLHSGACPSNGLSNKRAALLLQPPTDSQPSSPSAFSLVSSLTRSGHDGP